MIKLTGMPIPPSINKQYAVYRGRMIKTADARQYEQKVNLWAIRNQKQINTAKDFVLSLEPNFMLEVNCVFLFKQSRLFCKSNKKLGDIKKLDANNRLKSYIDTVCLLLDFDDKHIFKGDCIKWTIAEDQSEMAIAQIKVLKLEQMQTQLFFQD